MNNIIAVSLFAVGIALLMQSSNVAALHRSRTSRTSQGSGGRKSWGFVILGAAMALGGLGLFVASALAPH